MNSSITDTEIIERVTKALKEVYDPEMPVDVYELGLIYGISYDDSGRVIIEMTLTSPGCPVAEDLPEWVRESVTNAGFKDVEVVLVWDPPWDWGRMSLRAKIEMGFDL